MVKSPEFEVNSIEKDSQGEFQPEGTEEGSVETLETLKLEVAGIEKEMADLENLTALLDLIKKSGEDETVWKKIFSEN